MPTIQLLAECQRRVVQLMLETSQTLVLYDALEMSPPAVDVAWAQRSLDADLAMRPRRAIVVPNTKIAYLARLAFADEYGESRIFYSDMAQAFEWLKSSS